MKRGGKAKPSIWLVFALLVAGVAPPAGAEPGPRTPGDLSWASAGGTQVPRTFAGYNAVDTYASFIAVGGSVRVFGEDSDPYYGPPLLEADGLVAWLDATNGSEVWSHTFHGAPDTFQSIGAVAISPDGSRLYATGSDSAEDFSSDVLVLAFDTTTGDLLWEQRVGDSSMSRYGQEIAVTPDGSAVVVGGSGWENGKKPIVEPTGGRFISIAIDATTGDTVWHREFQSKSGLIHIDGMNDMALSPDGTQVVVTGMSMRKGFGIDYLTIAYAVAGGARSWKSWHDGTGVDGAFSQDIAEGIVFDPDGSQVIVTGYAGSRNRGYEIATMAYQASDGHRRWLRRYDGPAPGNTSDIPTGIAMDPGGERVYITGHDYRFVSTLAYDPADGKRKWLSIRDNSDGKVKPSKGLAVSPVDASLLMGGRLRPKANPISAMALNPDDGAEMWSAPPPPGLLSFSEFAAGPAAMVVVGAIRELDPAGNSSAPFAMSYDLSP